MTQNIGLLDVDGKRFPNLALMKIHAYHTSLGDSVEFYSPSSTYDIVYKSKVFTFSPDRDLVPGTAKRVIKGGTGYSLHTTLPDKIENILPTLPLYECEHAYGFLTRGCPNSCSWCVVPRKEGGIRAYDTIERILQGRKSAVLMDNNVLASPHGLGEIENIARLRVKVDFNQGLDARLIVKDEGIAELLGKVRWLRPARLACDTDEMMGVVEKAVGLMRKHGVTRRRYFVYVLAKDVESGVRRARFLWDKLKVDPFIQPYRDLNSDILPSKELRELARWCNHKAIFKSVPWERYKVGVHK